MKRFLYALILVLPLTLAMAGEWNLVRIPAPSDPAALQQADFTLFHRAGDYWIGGLPQGKILPSGGMILREYDPTAGDLFRILIPASSEADKLVGRVHLLYRDDDEAIFQATPTQLEALPVLRAEWVRITTTAKPFGYSGVTVPQTDDFNPMVQEFVNQVSQVQYTQSVQTLQNFVTRNTRTANCDSAAAWILSKFQGYGLNAYYDYFTISGMQKRNVIGELTGLVHPDSLIFITAHYDATAGSPSTPEAVAPGADDNASGTACVVECARILAQHHFDKTIRFVAFAGEEQGLYGSEDYVSNLMSAGAHVVGSFNWDMIAWSGNDPPPPDLVIYADNNPRSQAMANKIAEACATFVPGALEPLVTIAPSMGSSDHGPFWDVGWPAICGIEEEAWGPDFNPYYHSVNDLISNCNLVYATNCTRSAIAALSDYAMPLPDNGPVVTLQSYDLEDLNGNLNGSPDPGENISIQVTLINVGNQAATSIVGAISSTSPYLTITQSSTTYPNLNPNATGAGAQPYLLTISASCPQGNWVSTTLTITASGGYQNACFIDFQVGNPLYSPTGPDEYGYYAFDRLDPNGPVFNWIEIDPAAGGSGTVMSFTGDDQTLSLNLPFTFSYYGQNYTQLSVCTNGWVSMGVTSSTDYSNSAIPDADGPPAMIAPFWDDLSPQIAGHICYYYNLTQQIFIVEYRGVRQYSPATAYETFEIVLYDPITYPTPTGDGKILFQYKDVTDPSSCTVGIEDQAETIGLQFLLNTAYEAHAAPIIDSTAILFTTVESFPPVFVDLTPQGLPIQIPAAGGTFNYTIAVTNSASTSQTFDVWCDVTLPNGQMYGPVLGPVNVTFAAGFSTSRNRTQNVPASAPAGQYIYHGYTGIYPAATWDEDTFDFTKLPTGTDGAKVANWDNWGEAFEDAPAAFGSASPREFSLSAPYPNPFNPTTVLKYTLTQASPVHLTVYGIDGRLVQTLVEGWRGAGSHEVTFDGSSLASGIYLCRLSAEGQTATTKLILIK